MKEEKIGVTILTIVFLALVISLFFSIEPRYTGLAVGACTDSDNGQDIYVQGTTAHGNTTFTDECFDAGNVREGYCDVGILQIDTLPCPAGYNCLAGRCNSRLGQQVGIEQVNSTTTSSTLSSSTTVNSTTSSSTSSITSTSINASSTTTSINATSSTTSSSSTTAASTSTSTSSTSTSTSSTTTTNNQSQAATESTALCIPDFQCSDWTSCINGVTTRTCNDVNNCGFDDKIERDRCSAAESTVEQTSTSIEENNTAEGKQDADTAATGLAIADTSGIGKAAAGVIWATVAISAVSFVLNRYKPRWWLVTKYGTRVFLGNAGEHTKAGLARVSYKIKNMFGRKEQ